MSRRAGYVRRRNRRHGHGFAGAGGLAVLVDGPAVAGFSFVRNVVFEFQVARILFWLPWPGIAGVRRGGDRGAPGLVERVKRSRPARAAHAQHGGAFGLCVFCDRDYWDGPDAVRGLFLFVRRDRGQMESGRPSGERLHRKCRLHHRGRCRGLHRNSGRATLSAAWKPISAASDERALAGGDSFWKVGVVPGVVWRVHFHRCGSRPDQYDC